ncbi:MAG: hypothetical protein PVI67_14570, partial [Anaerolineae bacterium]
LGQRFITQLDCEDNDTSWDGKTGTCEPDEKRDLSVFLQAPGTDHSLDTIGNSTIKQRFDISNTVTSTARWGIEAAQDKPFPLRVDNFRYENQDYLGYHAKVETPRILAQYSHTLTPTLLFAREERYRMAGLEALTNTVSVGIAVDLGTKAYPQETMVGLVWAPFRTNAGTGEWEAYPATEYWDALGNELKKEFYQLYQEDSPEANLGRMVVARAYQFALMNGVVNGVQCTPDQPLCQVDDPVGASDGGITKAGKDLLNGLNVATILTLKDFVNQRTYVKVPNPVRAGLWNYKYTPRSLGVAVSKHGSIYDTLLSAPPSARAAAGIVAAAAGVTIVATIVIAYASGIDGARAAAVVIRNVSLAIATHCLVHTLVTQWNAFKSSGQGLGKFLRLKTGWNVKLDNVLKAGAVQMAITVALTWAAFGIQFAVTKMKWGSMGADNAFAMAIAGTIVTILLFIITTALGPIGAIVNAFIGMLNALANAICSALPPDMQKSNAGKWLCGGITGILTNAVKWLFYSGTIMVKMDPDDYERLSLYDFDSALVEEEDGMVAGSHMRYTVGLTNTIDLVKVPITPFKADYGYQFNEQTLANSTFLYRWQTQQEDLDSELSLGQMVGYWEETDGGRPFYYADTVPSEPIPLPGAGINQSLGGLYLSEAYAVPEQECWAFVGCEIKTERSTTHFDMGSGLIYDVLPATLDGFYQLARKGDGWALAWDQQGDLTFPTLYDADGDGLSHADDPDDSSWDADGDGLSDVYELNHGTNALRKDTDDDGLTDHQEAQFGSDATSADGDGDGLLDCQEVFHEIVVVGDAIAQDACGAVVGAWTGGWTFVYGMDAGQQKTTLVTSDPTRADTEADGLTDRQELIYGYNPGVCSELNVLSLSSELSESVGGAYEPTDRFVAPNQTLRYSATVKNELDNRQAEGLLWTEASPILDRSQLMPEAFNLRPQAEMTMMGDLEVLPAAASGTYSLTQVAGALIADLSAESDQASLWLRFDDPAGSTVFADSSGRVPAHDGVCQGSCTVQPADGRAGGALGLDNAGWVHSDAAASGTGYGLSLWFRTTEGGGLFAVKGEDPRYAGIDLWISSPSDFCPGCGNYNTILTPGVDTEYGSFSKSTPLTDGRWHHLVHTFGGDAGEQKIYLDGALVVSGWLTELSTAQTGIDIGGCDPSFGAHCTFSGSIDDVRLFDRGLTHTDVQALFEMPIFKMDFEQSQQWVDLSTYRSEVSCGL